MLILVIDVLTYVSYFYCHSSILFHNNVFIVHFTGYTATIIAVVMATVAALTLVIIIVIILLKRR